MKLGLIALMLAATTLSACSNVAFTNSEHDSFTLYGDEIPLLTNDTLTECTKTQPNNDTICILVSGTVSEERIGKVLAYGLLLDKAGWSKHERPLESFVSAEALKTPDYAKIHYRKTQGSKCIRELTLTPITLSGGEKTELTISQQSLGCDE